MKHNCVFCKIAKSKIKAEIQKYLLTGECDEIYYSIWPGSDIFERGMNAHKTLTEALYKEMKLKEAKCIIPELPEGFQSKA